MAARLGNITFDCDDVLRLAGFWSAVLGRPLDQGSSKYFASIGGADPQRQEPAWYFNQVPESKQAKNRVHLDLVMPDPGALDELTWLGATCESPGDGPVPSAGDRPAGVPGHRAAPGRASSRARSGMRQDGSGDRTYRCLQCV